MALEDINNRIGGRMRARRRALKMTQAKVAQTCGVCFQQIQKYEAGAVQISAWMLWRMAQALDVEISYFFEDVSARPTGGQDGAWNSIAAAMNGTHAATPA